MAKYLVGKLPKHLGKVSGNNNAVVELLWGGTINSTMVLLNCQGHWDLRTFGDGISNNAGTATGDVLLSTRNFVSGDNYTILAEFR